MTKPVILVNPAGIPEPSPEIQRRLREVHGGLKLRLMDTGVPTWAVCMEWQPDDRRWEWVQTESYDPRKAHDIIGYLPLDCRPEESPAYLSRMLRTYPSGDIQRLADSVDNYNTGVVNSAVEEAIGDMLDSADPSTIRRGRGRPRKVS
jgi:hypothetical protein